MFSSGTSDVCFHSCEIKTSMWQVFNLQDKGFHLGTVSKFMFELEIMGPHQVCPCCLHPSVSELKISWHFKNFMELILNYTILTKNKNVFNLSNKYGENSLDALMHSESLNILYIFYFLII